MATPPPPPDQHSVQQILNDLEVKPLIVGGEPGNGKTTLVKHIAYEALKRGWVVQGFDPSLAWYHDSPLSYRYTCSDWASPPNEACTMYDVGGLTPDDRRFLTARVIKEHWDRRSDGVRENPNYLKGEPIHLIVLEEGNTFWSSSSLNKTDWCGSTLTDFISIRRNLRFAAVIVATAVSGEIATKYRRRCNYVLSRVMSDEERRYLAKSTSKEAVEAAVKLPKYKFVYYGSEEILKPFGVPYRKYPSPKDYPRWVPSPEPTRVEGFLGKIKGIFK